MRKARKLVTLRGPTTLPAALQPPRIFTSVFLRSVLQKWYRPTHIQRRAPRNCYSSCVNTGAIRTGTARPIVKFPGGKQKCREALQVMPGGITARGRSGNRTTAPGTYFLTVDKKGYTRVPLEQNRVAHFVLWGAALHAG